MTIKQEHTPLIAQYLEIKAQYPDALLLFQVGDFYELFFDDAVKAANYLAITLTKRGKAQGEDIALCGVPVHALSHYLVKLVKGGFTVAICDQVTKPQPGTVVKRAVTKVYTPGTLTDTQLLDEKSASYLCTLFPDSQGRRLGLLFIELLTAQIAATVVSLDEPRLLEAELGRFFPDEIVLPAAGTDVLSELIRRLGYIISPLRGQSGQAPQTADELLNEKVSLEWMNKHLMPASREQVEAERSLAGSVEVLYRYLQRNNAAALEQLSTISFYEPASFVHLDPATQRNLEVVKNNQGTSAHTLFAVVDRAQTAMGSRMLKKWLMRPLRDKIHIERRSAVVACLANSVALQQQLRATLRQIADLERIVGRIALGRAQLGDYKTLYDTLRIIPIVRGALAPLAQTALIEHLLVRLPLFSDLISLLESAINDDDQVEGLIKKGFSQRLDRLRELVSSGQHELLALANREAAAYDIGSLKVLYTSVAGYFIEITHTHVGKVPTHYRQIATLAGRARYVTDELKALEREIFQAREDIEDVEKELFASVEAHVRTYTSPLRQAANALAIIDALAAFADLAYTNNYVQPVLVDKGPILITQGRHSVVEQALSMPFMANDTSLGDEAILWLITGPNMGGKSTYLRQVALICLLAQCGSFVPAQSAQLPILDRIFTRIGAGDDVAQGKSTFLVEMEETAAICNQATSQSLVILDEVGRGTSTDDGRALAQAIIEYLVDQVGCKALFATHYHELTLLADSSSKIANYHMQCQKKGEQLHFLHTLAQGVAQASFGIDVARLAHLPPMIIARARQLLDSGHSYEAAVITAPFAPTPDKHLSKEQESVLQQLAAIDSNELTPKAAFDLIWRLQQQIK